METIYKKVSYPGAPGSSPGEGSIKGNQAASWKILQFGVKEEGLRDL